MYGYASTVLTLVLLLLHAPNCLRAIVDGFLYPLRSVLSEVGGFAFGTGEH